MTKVDIISGFLGAGKTTFIKELISKVYNGEKTNSGRSAWTAVLCRMPVSK